MYIYAFKFIKKHQSKTTKEQNTYILYPHQLGNAEGEY